MTDEAYHQLEERINNSDFDGLMARWECGGNLLEERGTARRLPNGRLEQLSRALGKSSAELSNRMQFAAEYETEEKVRAAFTIHGSWYAICARGLGDRRQFGAPDGPVNDEELTLAGVQHDLEEWGLLKRNALAGLSNLERRAVVTELRRAFDLYCEDPVRFKEPSWTGQQITSVVQAAGGAGPDSWTHDDGWYPPYTVSPEFLRSLAGEVISALRTGRASYREVPRHFTLWDRLRVPVRARLEATPLGNLMRAGHSFVLELKEFGHNAWKESPGWRLSFLVPNHCGAVVHLEDPYMVLEPESKITPEGKGPDQGIGTEGCLTGPGSTM